LSVFLLSVNLSVLYAYEKIKSFLLVVCAYVQAISLPVIIWLLRNRFLYQVHNYVMLLPSTDVSVANTTIDSRTAVHSSDISMSGDSSTDASSLSTCILAADVANPSHSLSTSDTDTSVNNSSLVDGRRVYLDVKDHTTSSEFFLLLVFLFFTLHCSRV